MGQYYVDLGMKASSTLFGEGLELQGVPSARAPGLGLL